MTPTTTGNGGRTLIKWIFLGLMLVIVISYGSCQYTRAKKEVEAKKVAADKVAAEYAKTHPPQPRPIPPTQRPWSFRTLNIPSGDGIAIHLSQGWRGFTQGGAITITTPSGRLFHDKPGISTEMGFQPDGIFVFRAEPVGSARKIVIYNRW